jgi:serine/threonine-protein kinase
MLVLPKTIGSLTLERKIGTGNVAEAYLATQRNGKPALVRRILPFIARDPARLAAIEARVNELAGFRHPALVHVIGTVEEGGETFMVEDRVDGVSLERVIVAARTHNSRIPANLFLHIAVQVCNALEALHSRPSPSGADSTLHLGVKPGAVFVAHDGKVTVGSFGLTRSPTSLPQGGVASAITPRMEYLSPEQTHFASLTTNVKR